MSRNSQQEVFVKKLVDFIKNAKSIGAIQGIMNRVEGEPSDSVAKAEASYKKLEEDTRDSLVAVLDCMEDATEVDKEVFLGFILGLAKK